MPRKDAERSILRLGHQPIASSKFTEPNVAWDARGRGCHQIFYRCSKWAVTGHLAR
jgi:hypothetical protein